MTEEYWNPMVPELSVTNFDKSLSFYRDLLGFHVRVRRSNPNFAYLALASVQIMIEQIHDEAWVSGELSYPLGRGINFQIEVTKLSPLLSRLKEAEVPLFRDETESWYDLGGGWSSGQREFLVQDPDGYLLRFTQPLGERRQ